MLNRACLVLCGLSSLATAFFDGFRNVSDPNQALQVRLAYNGPFGMTVSWNTFGHQSRPTVRYGLTPYTMFQSASSDVSVTYQTSLTYNNHVQLNYLLPNTKYYYLPADSHETIPLSFTTSRLAGDPTPFTVAAVVDMGTFGPLGLSTTTGAANPLAPGEQTTIMGIQKKLDDFEFMVHPGDIAYADYWLKEEIQGYLPKTTLEQGALVYEHILNAFFDEVEPLTSVKPYMVGPGNHEANCDNGKAKNATSGVTYTEAICMMGQTNFTGYRNHWRMPSGPSGGLENFWYSYDHGMAHFISIDTETDLGHGLQGPDEGAPEFGGPFAMMNAQLDWLQNDLAKVDRKKTPWVVVFAHRPLYSSTDGNCANCKTVFEPLFNQYGVDFYLSGHAHVYERMAPIYANTIDPAGLNNPKGTMYILNGAAGHYDGLDTLESPLEPYSRYAEDSFYAWSKLQFHNCTHMTHQAINSATGEVFDEATLFKDRKCGFQLPFQG